MEMKVKIILKQKYEAKLSEVSPNYLVCLQKHAKLKQNKSHFALFCFEAKTDFCGTSHGPPTHKKLIQMSL